MLTSPEKLKNSMKPMKTTPETPLGRPLENLNLEAQKQIIEWLESLSPLEAAWSDRRLWLKLLADHHKRFTPEPSLDAMMDDVAKYRRETQPEDCPPSQPLPNPAQPAAAGTES